MAADRAAGYTDADVERFMPERRSQRGEFARDRARVLHSAGLRRLAAKTQVLSPASDADFARNRLTHSLEVAQIGRELASALGLSDDVVDAACLSHDLGHPPFGHNGERALNAWASDIGGFEGNAQSLRILTRLEPKITGDDRSVGLNLTRATLDATCKYPWTIDDPAHDPGGRLKFGVYPEDEEIYRWMRGGAPARARCIEAQVMDLADDIAYSVHDFEDAVVNGYVDVPRLADPAEHDAFVGRIQAWVGYDYSRDELAEALSRLTRQPMWLTRFERSRADLARLKNLTSDFIGRFASASVDATRAAYADASLTRYGADVVVPREIELEIAALKGIMGASIVTIEARRNVYVEQRRVLTRIADALWNADTLWSSGADQLDPSLAADFLEAGSDAERKRVIVDQVASLTDQTAVAWHSRLVGDIDPASVGIWMRAAQAAPLGAH
ncbi:deoxyguanosinetriphosphate triphosphohydrolase [Microbacterium faecale]|uniref:Deoxyguanosinetriphosphate triphosphohydrolase n=1 Tax=Microbacterium faecale TaxID=1804630 RepID=A0A916YDJ4_9MICO|nr:deoxyguanosinetriphosphate triphosphohydrolase [Microbacterium faecale]GGD39258.1 deoxyguanosinetriphosphate triphosphohydrolase [Microbacterium faecale]